MTYYVLYNPLAGSKGTGEPAWLTALTEKETVTRHDITTVSKDYPAFFASLSEDDVVILLGGDGTLNRFVNDTDGMHIAQDILYAPGGTGNDFLRDLDKTPDGTPVCKRCRIRHRRLLL